MKIIFFGLGSIGKRHARLLQKHFSHQLYAFRSQKNGKKNLLGMPEIYTFEEVDAIHPDIAFITNPTSEHLSTATACARRNIALFIEKPLSHQEEGFSDFVRLLRRNKIPCYVAYCLRFHPVIEWLKKYLQNKKALHVTAHCSSYLPHWREGVDHLKNYSARKELGGGVILDLSHEIDYLYYLLGNLEVMSAQSGKLSTVTVDAEDFMDVFLKFKSGTYGNVHVDCFSPSLRREMILQFTDHSITADLIKQTIEIVPTVGSPKLLTFPCTRDDIFVKQLRYFFKHYCTSSCMNTLNEAEKVFSYLLEIKKITQP